MNCLAVSLDSKTNMLLNKISKEISTENSLLINNFHLTLFCFNEFSICENFLEEFKQNNFIFEKMRPICWSVLEGKNTDYDYLTIEVCLPFKIKNEIIRLRNKFDPCTGNNHLDLKPHISIAKAPKGSFGSDLIKFLNKKYHQMPTFKTKELILINHDFKLVKKDQLSKFK